MDKDEEHSFSLRYLPLLVSISMPGVVIITYIIAVSLGHVDAGFPYISDAATTAPESCIFAQAVNIIAALTAFIIYIRYNQVKECSSTFNLQESLLKWNYWSLYFGLAGTFGFTIVANFQESSVLVVHMLGAFICFGSSTVYFWAQAVCTFRLHPIGSSLRLAHFRTALAIFCTVCFIVTGITGMLSFIIYKGKDHIKWNKDEGGWELHMASTISEWLCSLTFCIYIQTFSEEFKNFKITHPKIVCIRNRSRLSNEALNESQNSAMINDGHTTMIT